MLAEIYNWFTEAFDTADLKDAKAFSRNCARKSPGLGARLMKRLRTRITSS
jgi:hypothetical protein